MKQSMMKRNLQRSILRSFGRYLAIVAIIALGASMFVGLLMTKSDMVATGQRYTREQNMFDLRLVSTYGWDPDTAQAVAELPGVREAEGLLYADLLASLGDSSDDSVFRFYAMPQAINRLVLLGGRMPERPDECLADGYHTDDGILGTTITLSPANDTDALEGMHYTTYTVVGYVSTPLYMDMNRGTTSVGSGSINYFCFVPGDAFSLDYCQEIHVTLPGTYNIYTDEYNQAMESAANALEPMVQTLADARLSRLKLKAEEAYADGLQQYEDGMRELEDARQEAQEEMDAAYASLSSGQAQIEANEASLAAAQTQIAQGKQELADGEKQLEDSKAQLQSLKSTLSAPLDATQSMLDSSYASLKPRLDALTSELSGLDQEIAALNEEISRAEAEFSDLTAKIQSLSGEISSLDAEIAATTVALEAAKLFPTINADWIASLEASLSRLNAQRAELAGRRETLEAQRQPYLDALEEPYAQRQELENRRRELAAEKAGVDVSMAALEQGYAALEESRKAADAIFASSEAEIAAGEASLAEAKEAFAQAEAQLASGKKQLEQAKVDLEQGWKEYYEGKAKAENEFARAENDLAKARDELEKARDALNAMDSATVYLLDRNTNVGYASLSSSSDIVAGVSRVFPTFFLLVAALVCITTMTRMIDEERTQIGTLKALGYSNAAIIGKYLAYAGSGAVLGCGMGVIIGSVVFPTVLWEAYKIMLFITDDIVLQFNWWLCAAVVGAYTAVMLLVTWYCCRKALKEEPAELIRPKAPDPGKKILLERLPFWSGISFLNKVTIRNIFRYRQRLAMMIVGIGGCTALLLTGYGLRDSIVNVVDYQFEEVTTYDISVYFDGDQDADAQENFLQNVRHAASDAMFYHQSSVELSENNLSKEIYLIAADDGIQRFIDFHSNNTPLPVPGLNEVLLSAGVAEALGIHTGDEIVLRNSDMEMLTVTVSGIYDNHVYNYAIVSTQTIQAQWDRPASMQMAFLKTADGTDVHELSALISGMDHVLNVSVSEDLADMVGSMMDAMDLVVVVIVFCAGLLAAIVLYNLTNINITERIREIATIKVLGFNAAETAAYVFKENVSLTVIGSVFGLGLGYLLLLFVMTQIKIDLVWFKALAKPMSYVASLALTMVAACIVNFVFYFKLEKINMAEALKSVE